MSKKLMIQRVNEMLEYRGMKDLKTENKLIGTYVYNGDVVFFIDNQEKFQNAKTENNSRILSEYKQKKKGYAFIFDLVGSNVSNSKEKIRKFNPSCEIFDHSDLFVDHRQGKFATNWKIATSEELELFIGIPIESAPIMLDSDIISRYMGAKIGEFLLFDRLEMDDVGPNTVIGVREVVSSTRDLAESFDYTAAAESEDEDEAPEV